METVLAVIPFTCAKWSKQSHPRDSWANSKGEWKPWDLSESSGKSQVSVSQDKTFLWQREVRAAKDDMLDLINCNMWFINYFSFTQDFTINLSKKKPKFELEGELK